MKFNTKLTPGFLHYTRYQIDHNCAPRVHLVVVQFNKRSFMLTTVTRVMHCTGRHNVTLPLYPGHVGGGKHFRCMGGTSLNMPYKQS